MNRRNKWILIGCLACVVAVVAYLVYTAIWFTCYMKSMEVRKPVLLYETNHRELLEACRELSRQVTTGRLKPGSYQINVRKPDPETRQFPRLIQDLVPLHVDVTENGLVDLIMSSDVIYGVLAYPEDHEKIPTNPFKYRNGSYGIELIEGLWYYDEDFQKHPEHMKDVEELLKKRKAGDSFGVP